MKQKRDPILTKEQLESYADHKNANKWWLSDGLYIDPDTSEVDWHNKRAELAQMAFIAGCKSARESR